MVRVMETPLLTPPDQPRRFVVGDARADGQRRHIELSRERVVIRRGVSGVPMTIAIATRDFAGVSLRLRISDDAVATYQLVLVHHDSDLTVPLAQAGDESDLHAAWRDWARFFGLPTLVERTLGHDTPERPALPAPRRRGSWITARRPRFLTRRKAGDPSRMTVVDKEQELFPLL